MRAVFAAVLLSSVVSATAWGQDLDPAVADDLRLDTVVTGLSAATAAEFLPDGRIVIIEQSGRIVVWEGEAQAREIGSFEVGRGNERGLLGLAVDPQFVSSRRLYLYYSEDGRQSVGWVELDPETDQILGPPTTILRGAGGDRNHNGGGIVFGPDDLLYVGVGDTGCNCGCLPGSNRSNYYPTCLTNLQGKILRIDREGGIPASNPLTGVESVPECTGELCRNGANIFPETTGPPATEIYNWGFRNPWRFAFDEQTGFMWIGDVGEVSWEEVTISTGPGQHHGWPFREGANGQEVGRCDEVTGSGDCRDPAFQYAHGESPVAGRASVTGGVFSNHCSWPEPYAGRYWFGDFEKARVWTLTPNAARDGVEGERTLIVARAAAPVHFFNGPAGAIYYVATFGGSILRISPASPIDCVDEMDAGFADAGDEVADVGEVDGSVPGDAAGVMDATPANPDAEVTTPADAASTSSDEDDDGDDCSCSATRPVDPNDTPPWRPLGALLLIAAVLRPRRP